MAARNYSFRQSDDSESGRILTPVDIDSLTQRIIALDETACVELAHVFGPRLRGFFIKRGVGYVEAEDLSVTCITDFVLAIINSRYTCQGAASSFLFTIARNALSDWRKEQIKRSTGLQSLGALQSDDLTPNMTLVLAVNDAFDLLSRPDQEIISLRFFSEFEPTFKEIGERLGISEQTARVRHFRALKRLESMLTSDPRVQCFLAKQSRRIGGMT